MAILIVLCLISIWKIDPFSCILKFDPRERLNEKGSALFGMDVNSFSLSLNRDNRVVFCQQKYNQSVDFSRKKFLNSYAQKKRLYLKLSKRIIPSSRHGHQCLTESLQCMKTSRNQTRNIDVTDSEKYHVGEGVQGTKFTGSVFHDFNNSVEPLGNGGSVRQEFIEIRCFPKNPKISRLPFRRA